MSDRSLWKLMFQTVVSGDIFKSEKKRVNLLTKGKRTFYNDLWLELQSITLAQPPNYTEVLLDHARDMGLSLYQQVMEFKQENSKDIENLLFSIDVYERLFPSLKAMRLEKPFFEDINYIERVDALRAYMNCQDAIHSITQFIIERTRSEELWQNMECWCLMVDSGLADFAEDMLKEYGIQCISKMSIVKDLNRLLHRMQGVIQLYQGVYEDMQVDYRFENVIPIANFPLKLVKIMLELKLESSTSLSSMHLSIEKLKDLKISIESAVSMKESILRKADFLGPQLGPKCVKCHLDSMLRKALYYYMDLLEQKKYTSHGLLARRVSLDSEWKHVYALGSKVSGSFMEILRRFNHLFHLRFQQLTCSETEKYLSLHDFSSSDLTSLQNIWSHTRTYSWDLFHALKEYAASTMNSINYELDYEKIDQVLGAIQSLDSVMLFSQNDTLAIFCYSEDFSYINMQTIGEPFMLGRIHYIVLPCDHIETLWTGLSKESATEVDSDQFHLDARTLKIIFPPKEEKISASTIEKALLSHGVQFSKKSITSHDYKITQMVQDTLQQLLEYGHWRLNCIDEWSPLCENENVRDQWFELFMNILSETALFCWKIYQLLRQIIASEDLERLRQRLIILAGRWLCMCDRLGTWALPQSNTAMRHTISAMEFGYKIIDGAYLNQLSDQEFKRLTSCVGRCSQRLNVAFDLHGCRYRTYQRTFGKETKQITDFGDPSAKSLLDFGIDWAKFNERHTESLVKSLDELDSKLENERKDLKGKVLEITSEKERGLCQLASSSIPVNFKWHIGRYIGAGSFGTVYMAFNEETGDIMAVKEIRYGQARNFQVLQELLLHEIRIFQSLRHIYVVTYYGIEVHRDKLYLLMDYCPASLTKLIKDRETVSSLTLLKAIIKQMIQGLYYLHSHSIAHRDIKPDNILIGFDGNLKYVDFGNAKALGNTYSRKYSSLVGTPYYMSPEVVRGEETNVAASDIWSLGCCIVELVTGIRPWADLDNEWAIMYHIGIFKRPPVMPTDSQITEQGVEFLNRFFACPAEERATATELLQHDFLANVMEEGVLKDWASPSDREMELEAIS